nr:DUF6538 domain-containing protein [Methylomonas koyamae]
MSQKVTQGRYLAMLVRMKYLHQKQPNGVYYFRKRVPGDLVERVGKRLWMQSLKTSDLIKAQLAAKRLDRDLEATWAKLRQPPESPIVEAQRIYEALTPDAANPSGLSGTDIYLDCLEGKQPIELVAEYEGSLRMLDDPSANLSNTEKKVLDLIVGRPVTLSDAVAYYIEMSGKRNDRKFTQSVRQALAFFVDALGDRPIDQYKRREVEERLVSGVQSEGLKTATVSRRLSTVKSAVNKAILNLEYSFKNPFEKHTIPGLRDDEDSRSSLTAVQQAALLALLNKPENSDTLNGLRILFDTGMRVSECVGLRVEDVHLEADIPYIKLHRNPLRRLKTKQSQRSIPLIGYALMGIKLQLELSQGGEWLFPRYIDLEREEVKNDGASNAMNGRLKALGFTCHCLRHNLKDRLRLADVSMDHIRELQGWSRSDQASRYGEMSLLGVLQDKLKRIEILS